MRLARWPARRTTSRLRTACPGYAGKDATIPTLVWEALAHAACADLVHAFFNDATGTFDHASAARFYPHPPIAYAAFVSGCLSFVCLVELVGRLLVTPITQPRFFGSSAWRADIKALPAHPWAESNVPFVLDDRRAQWAKAGWIAVHRRCDLV